MGSVGSPSITRPDYWWYRARADLLSAALSSQVGAADRVLDVGSADGPSVGWLDRGTRRTALDLDPRGLSPGDVCASALQLPFADGTFDVVAAFDVVEHCDPESAVLAELERVLRPGGRLLVSVPAYQWAWSEFDVHNGHHRRYTRRRLVAAVQAQGLHVLRATYIFAGTFPFFAAHRLRSRASAVRPAQAAPDDVPALPETGPRLAALLTAATGIDRRLLRHHDLPFGSSVVLAAQKGAGA